jgi:hypothetical protein
MHHIGRAFIVSVEDSSRLVITINEASYFAT